ncbi:DUF859 domain-containing protein [Streptococcus uberis]|uniref:DUF859 family phage minor structural protein n=1 Tax=Streptococcus uberis TaxID=1349 RepID=UPI001FF4BFF7|nr:DUF859 family phage minor structural protein [Streptococcus uberis]MCK1200580.1 DUF859 domain-containing protein [Streptococcus uberis]MCK1213821.1 DUF859 domain-containing protein [Streptococcus uberis]
MATSNFSGSWGGNLTLDASYVVKSQDVVKNQSVITLTVKLNANGYASISGAGTKSLTLNVNGGGAIQQVDVNISAGQSKQIWQADYTIPHNPDGTKSFTITTTLDINIGGYGSATVSFPAYMPKINRTSTVSMPSATMGNATTITVTRSDASYTHTLRYDWYGKTGTIATGVATSFSWTVPLTFANDIPNSTVGNGKIYVDTYSGSTLLGTSSATLTASVPTSIIPMLASVSLSDTNSVASGITGGSPNFIQIYSGITVNFGTASGAYGSTISNYYAEIVGKNISINSNGGTFSNLNFSGSFILRSKVIDSRGRESAVVDTNIKILEYKPPVLNFTVARTGSTSSTFTITRNASISPLTVNSVQKNVMTLTFKVAPANSSTFTTDNGPASGSWTATSSFVNSQANLAGTYDATNSWRVQGVLSDKFSSTTFEAPIVTTETAVMSYDKDGRVGVGKIADLSLPAGSVDSFGGFFVNGKSLLDIFYPVGTIYESVNATNPSTFMGGTWTRFGNGKVLVGVDENDADFNTVNKTGGEKKHTQTIAEMPSHTHGGDNGKQFHYYTASSGETGGDGVNSGTTFKSSANTGATGGGQPFNILQPYVTIYRWQRTA